MRDRCWGSCDRRGERLLSAVTRAVLSCTRVGVYPMFPRRRRRGIVRVMPYLRSPSLPRVALSIALAAASLAASPPGWAQTPEELAAARQVFVEGKQLEGKGAWADALEKFKKV